MSTQHRKAAQRAARTLEELGPGASGAERERWIAKIDRWLRPRPTCLTVIVYRQEPVVPRANERRWGKGVAQR